MSITVFRGLPGSGKSSRVIEMVNAGVAEGRPVLTFACSDSPWLALREYIRRDRVLACRRPELFCRIDHLASSKECGTILAGASAETLAVFDDAYHFGVDIVPHWVEASHRGVEVLVAAPSDEQLTLLKDHTYTARTFSLTCQRCAGDHVHHRAGRGCDALDLRRL